MPRPPKPTLPRLLAVLLIAGTFAACSRPDEAPIRIGILHSTTGTLYEGSRLLGGGVFAEIG